MPMLKTMGGPPDAEHQHGFAIAPLRVPRSRLTVEGLQAVLDKA